MIKSVVVEAHQIFQRTNLVSEIIELCLNLTSGFCITQLVLSKYKTISPQNPISMFDKLKKVKYLKEKKGLKSIVLFRTQSNIYDGALLQQY